MVVHVHFNLLCEAMLKADEKEHWDNWMERLKQMRNDYESYTQFCNIALSAVTGKNDWKKNSGTQKISEFVTVSDEAFALLLLENSWEVWLDMSKKAKLGEAIGKVKRHNSEGGGLMTKYTTNGAYVKKNLGWSIEGRRRFVDLVKQVKHDREGDANKREDSFEVTFLKVVEAGRGNNRKRKRNDCESDFDDHDVNEDDGNDMYFE